MQAAIKNRLGWLDCVDWMLEQLPELMAWVKQTSELLKPERVVVIGMGGASLAAAVFAGLFPRPSECPELVIVDSTCPEMLQQQLDTAIAQSLFIVASKSGTTLETIDIYRLFFERVSTIFDNPAKRFIAITDKDSWLHQHSEANGFLKTFINPANIGGRYSALSYFGMVPAALYGVDIETLLKRASTLERSLHIDDPAQNPALALGMFIGNMALQGRNKMWLQMPAALAPLSAWIEQLVAESTGKQNTGILPVYVAAQSEIEADDVFVVAFYDHQTRYAADQSALTSNTDGCRMALRFDRAADIGAEFFRWECATAIAASYLRVNPFDEPEVAAVKQTTTRFIETGATADTSVVMENTFFGVDIIAATGVPVDTVTNVFERITPAMGYYIGLLAYLPMQPEFQQQLALLQSKLIERYQLSCTVGFGPRYLHSTGQYHKGGPQNGQFIQFIDDDQNQIIDVAVPGRDYTFATLFRAQADADITLLARRKLPIMRVRLKGDKLASLQQFRQQLEPQETA